MTDRQTALLAEARRIQESGYFGRSERLTQAFEILVNASESGRPIKEVELASEVFQNDIRLQSGLDSSVRALVHRLRRKLDQFYAERGAIDGMRLDIPKGTYVLQLVPVEAVEREDAIHETVTDERRPRSSSLILKTLCALLALALAGMTALYFTAPKTLMDSELSRLAELRSRPFWSEFLDSPRPTIIVLGRPKNAVEDEVSPQVLLASAHGVRNLAPVLYVDARNERFMTIMPSDRVHAEMIRNNNIIYLGKVDDLGPQLDHIWSGIRIAKTENGTEVIDRETGKRYAATSAPADATGTHIEYAILAAMNGPDGTRILIIAGSGNAAVSQAAAVAISSNDLEEIARRTNSAPNFEALYAVRAHGPSHQGAELLVAAPLPSGAWGTESP